MLWQALVTPCVGVWIEIEEKNRSMSVLFLVTPCVGVWIEISYLPVLQEC